MTIEQIIENIKSKNYDKFTYYNGDFWEEGDKGVHHIWLKHNGIEICFDIFVEWDKEDPEDIEAIFLAFINGDENKIRYEGTKEDVYNYLTQKILI